ncbi:MAG: DUF4142 domain-containing protein [Alcaligenaceae bacterium]|nr:DUF4142 domain-containing protein [Alcaligenaceae bacterium]
MKTPRSAIALAMGIAMAGFGAHAQTTQGMNPATAPQTGAAAHATDSRAQSPAAANNQGQPESQLNQQDRRFMENAIQGSYAEIEGSQLALDKAESQEVRHFAEMMIDIAPVFRSP